MKATRRGFLAAIGIGTAVAHAAPVAPVHDAADLKYLPASGANCERVVLLDDADGREAITLHGVTGIDQECESVEVHSESRHRRFRPGDAYLTVKCDRGMGGLDLESLTNRMCRRFIVTLTSTRQTLVFDGAPVAWNTSVGLDGKTATIKFLLQKSPTQITWSE